jgi:hypothetical protein
MPGTVGAGRTGESGQPGDGAETRHTHPGGRRHRTTGVSAVANNLQLHDDRQMAVGAMVEVVLLSVLPCPAAVLRYRTRTAVLDGGRHPDEVARDLAGLGGDRAGLLHSTSWRFQRDRVVLTYAALPDPDPAGAVAVPVDGGATSDDPLAPAPLRIGAGDVAAHACRHLAYLRHTDPLVAERAGTAPGLWRLIAAFTPTVAGLLVQPVPAPVR